jgi:hypothetical protein
MAGTAMGGSNFLLRVGSRARFFVEELVKRLVKRLVEPKMGL